MFLWFWPFRDLVSRYFRNITNVNLCTSWSQTKGQEIKEKIYIPFAFAFTELLRAFLPFESF